SSAAEGAAQQSALEQIGPALRKAIAFHRTREGADTSRVCRRCPGTSQQASLGRQKASRGKSASRQAGTADAAAKDFCSRSQRARILARIAHDLIFTGFRVVVALGWANAALEHLQRGHRCGHDGAVSAKSRAVSEPARQASAGINAF